VIESTRFFLLIILLIIATYTDLTQRKIFNWLTYPAIGLGIGIAGGETVIYDNWAVFSPILFSVVLCLVVYLLPFFFGWIGGGDLKLMLAICCLQGAQPFGLGFVMRSIFNITLIGAIMAAVLLIWKGSLFKGILGSFKLLVRPIASKEAIIENTIPYGVAISLGTFWTLLTLS
jgi:prepilin peptidase CpaA